MRQFIKVFLAFARVGAFTFGGGYSMLPIFQRDLVEKKGWLTAEEMADFYSVSQCLPGIIAVNTSILTGHKRYGGAGGVAAALGIAFPSIAIILVIAAFITRFSEIPIFGHAFAGIRVSVCVLIANSVIKLWKSAIVDKASLLIYATVFGVSVFTSFPVAVLVIAAGVAGVVIKAKRRHSK